MQGVVPGNSLQSLQGISNSQSGDSFAQIGDQSTTNEDPGTFEQLVGDLLNAQTPVNSLDPGGGGNLASGQLSFDQSGKALPDGNRHAAMLQAILSNQAKPAVLPPEAALATADSKALKTQAEELTALLTGKLGESRSGSLQGLSIENKLNRNLLLQQYGAQQPVANQSTSNQTPSLDNQHDLKMLGKSFSELLDFGSTKGIELQGTGKQMDDAVKSLLSSLKIEGGTQLDSGRADTSALNTALNSSTASKPTLSMSVPLGTTSAWQTSFGEKVMWMINQNIQGAEIKLNPPELGPLNVKLSMQQDQASIVFTSQNQHVREVIESALPRLREMLGESGLNLADVDVSDKSSSDSNDRALFSSDQHDEQGVNEKLGHHDDEEMIEHHIVHAHEPGRIDFYA